MSDPSQALVALGHLAAEVDADNPGPEARAAAEAAVEKAAQVDRVAEEWAQIPWLIGRALSMAAPELAQVYSQQACMSWGKSAAAVAEKYGWKDASIGPELGLAVSTLGFAVPSFLLIRERVRQAQEANDAGWFGKLVLWFKHRKAGGAPLPAQEAPGDGSKQ